MPQPHLVHCADDPAEILLAKDFVNRKVILTPSQVVRLIDYFLLEREIIERGLKNYISALDLPDLKALGHDQPT